MPPVESDEELERIEERIEQGETGLLLGVVPHKELLRLKPAFGEKPQSHHEDKGPGPSGQAGRLRIEKKGLL